MTDFPPPPTAPPPPPPGYDPGGPGASSTTNRATFGPRLGGWLLDGLLYGLLSAAFIVPAIVIGVAAFSDCVRIGDEVFCPPGAPNGGAIALAILLGLAGVVVVFVLYVRALARTGQTWGRKIAGVKVVRADTGEVLGLGKAIGRTLFASFISGSIFYLGYLWMLWDAEKQTWHDKVAGSVVVKV